MAVEPPPPKEPNESLLQLSLTTETLSFQDPLGQVRNRGLGGQGDIDLNGNAYQQVIKDVTNVNTGKGDADPIDIHFENGLWMHVLRSWERHPTVSRRQAQRSLLPLRRFNTLRMSSSISMILPGLMFR